MVSWNAALLVIKSLFINPILGKDYVTNLTKNKRSKLMRLWCSLHRRPATAQASLRIRTVSQVPSLFAHIKYGSRRRVRPKIRHLAPLDVCACAFEEWVYSGQKYHILMRWLKKPFMYFREKSKHSHPLSTNATLLDVHVIFATN